MVKTVAGEKVTCSGLLNYINAYVRAFNGNDLPEVSQTSCETCRSENFHDVAFRSRQSLTLRPR